LIDKKGSFAFGIWPFLAGAPSTARRQQVYYGDFPQSFEQTSSPDCDVKILVDDFHLGEDARDFNHTTRTEMRYPVFFDFPFFFFFRKHQPF